MVPVVGQVDREHSSRCRRYVAIQNSYLPSSSLILAGFDGPAVAVDEPDAPSPYRVSTFQFLKATDPNEPANESPFIDELGTPGTDCTLYVRTPTRSGTGIRAYSRLICDVNYPDIWMKVRLERERWSGTQTLVSRTNSCGSCDYLERTAGPWNCAGSGTYTYWNHSNAEILDWAGQTWYADTYRPTTRITC
jgi:hypothetical protein